MEENVKGIVLKTKDYKDNDKLATIFTLEKGVITAKFVGVKKEKAKMKAVAQPFVFADFQINEKSGFNTVTNCVISDNFYSLLSNYNKMMCGYIILDILSSILPAEKREEELFLLTLASLKNIEQNNEYIATIDYILKFLNFSGVKVEFPECKPVFFDKTSGEFCLNSNFSTVQIDNSVYATLKAIDGGQTVDVLDAKLKQCLHLLHNIIFVKLGEDITSFQFI